VKANALVHRQADAIPQLKVKTFSDTLADEKAGGYGGVAKSEVQAETVGNTLGIEESYHCSIL